MAFGEAARWPPDFIVVGDQRFPESARVTEVGKPMDNLE